MAKRKRLTPVDPLRMGSLETGPAPVRGFAAAPIAGVAAEASGTAALNEMAETLHQARTQGRMVLALPLAAVQADYLVRDRTRIDDEEMQSLRASLAARGQQTPIEVVALEGDRYGLISGWRRLAALRDLAGEEGATQTVLALLRQPDDSCDAYLAMVEENEIRVGLSYYERARIAAKAVEQGAFDTPRTALQALFHAASRAKRSKIGSFLTIVGALDGVLRFPEAIPERQGLALAQALEADAGLADRLRQALEAAAPETAEAERALIDQALRPARAPKATPAPEAPPGTLPQSLPARSEPCPGLYLTRDDQNRLSLYGPGVDDRLHRKLLEWLAAQG